MELPELLIGPVKYTSRTIAPGFTFSSYPQPAYGIEIEPCVKSEPTIDDFESAFDLSIKSEPASPTSQIDIATYKVARFKPPITGFDVGGEIIEPLTPAEARHTPPASSGDCAPEVTTLPLPSPPIPSPPVPASPVPASPVPVSPLPVSPLPASPLPPPSPPSPPLLASPLSSSPLPVNVSRATPAAPVSLPLEVRFVSPQLDPGSSSNRFGNRRNPGRRKSDSWPCEASKCDQKFSNKRIYEQHLSKAHKWKSAICSVCGKPLGRKDYMRDHIRSQRHLKALELARGPCAEPEPS